MRDIQRGDIAVIAPGTTSKAFDRNVRHRTERYGIIWGLRETDDGLMVGWDDALSGKDYETLATDVQVLRPTCRPTVQHSIRGSVYRGGGNVHIFHVRCREHGHLANASRQRDADEHVAWHVRGHAEEVPDE